MLLLAHAKINLTLDVLGRRPDGYHELRSVMQTVSLADELEVEAAAELSLEAEPAWLGGPENLVVRAAEELRRRTGYRGGARLRLRKRVPVAAGLGGGSSDAAAALRGLKILWALGLSQRELAEAAASVGSDVPFFVWGGTALVSGRGEHVQPLADLPAQPLVLARPPLGVSTAEVFGALTPAHYTDGRATATLVATLAEPPRSWTLHNALQETACRLYPVVDEVLAGLRAAGGTPVIMSGSGPTCFGLWAAPEAASRAAGQLRARGYEAWAVTTVRAAR